MNHHQIVMLVVLASVFTMATFLRRAFIKHRNERNRRNHRIGAWSMRAYQPVREERSNRSEYIANQSLIKR